MICSDVATSLPDNGFLGYVTSLPLYTEASGYPWVQTVIFYLRQRTLEITSLALLLAVACLGIVLLHSVRKEVPSEPPEEPWDSRPTLALGGTGLRIGYAFGCIAALQDYADLSDVRVTTVSGSIFAGFIAAAPQLNMGKMMKALLNVRDHMMSSGLKGCYLLDVDETVDMILEELTRTGGLTHDILKSIASNDQLHIDNFEDLHRVMAAAICIPPFFNRFARYEGHLAADGAFSSWFAVPDGCHPGKIVKLSPFFIPWARFRSMFLSTPHDVYECVHPFGLDRQLESFREGYERTRRQLADPSQWQGALTIKDHPIDGLERRTACIRRVCQSS